MKVGSSGAYATQRCLDDDGRSAEAVKLNGERLPAAPRSAGVHIARDARQSFLEQVLPAQRRRQHLLEGPGNRGLVERGQLISKGFRR